MAHVGEEVTLCPAGLERLVTSNRQFRGSGLDLTLQRPLGFAQRLVRGHGLIDRVLHSRTRLRDGKHAQNSTDERSYRYQNAQQRVG